MSTAMNSTNMTAGALNQEAKRGVADLLVVRQRVIEKSFSAANQMVMREGPKQLQNTSADVGLGIRRKTLDSQEQVCRNFVHL